jgi:hypothetical protein
VLSVQDPGFEPAGGQAQASANRSRLVAATKAIRRPFPNQAQLDETDNGDGTRTVRLALSERIYASSTVVSATLASGWRTGHGGGSIAGPANGSTRLAPLIISRWATSNLRLVSGSGGNPQTLADVDVVVAAPHPGSAGAERLQACAAMKLTAFDGTTSRDFWFTAPRSSSLYGDNLRCWGGQIDLSGLNPGMVSVHRTIYPWIGAARASGSAHNTGVNAGFGTAHDSPLHVAYDPTGTYFNRRFIYVDTSAPGGGIATHPTLAAAAVTANKARNIGEALEIIRVYATSSGNLAASNGFAAQTRATDYYEIVLTAGQVHGVNQAPSFANPQQNARLGLTIIRGDPADSNPRANCIWRTNAATFANTGVNRWWVQDLTLELGQAALFPGAGSAMVLERVTVRGKTGFEAGTNGLYASGVTVQAVQCSMSAYGFQPQGNLMRNVSRTIGASGHSMIGVTINREAGTVRTGNSFRLLCSSDGMIWNCRAHEWAGNFTPLDAASSDAGGTGVFGSPFLLRRAAIVNTLVEHTNAQPQMQVGEGTYSTLRDCIFEGSTLLGGRFNWHNDAPVPATAAGTTVTMGLMAHGLTTGELVTIAGCAPAAYNRVGVAVTVIDANRFSYVAGSAPGVLAGNTVFGIVTLPGGAVRQIVRENFQHIGIIVRNTAMDRNGTKHDVFTGDSQLTGSWELLYGVGFEGSLHANRGTASPQDFQYAYRGARQDVGVVPDSANVNWFGFVDPRTGLDGSAGTWDGDYRPASGSRLLGRAGRASVDQFSDGSARGASFASGAFAPAAGAVPPAPIGPLGALHPHGAGPARMRWRGEVATAGAAHSVQSGDGGIGFSPIVVSSSARARILIVDSELRRIAPNRD